MMQEDFSALFQRIYANLPLSSRGEIIAVIDDEPVTWNAAKLEIDNETEKGREILSKLANMGLLHE